MSGNTMAALETRVEELSTRVARLEAANGAWLPAPRAARPVSTPFAAPPPVAPSPGHVPASAAADCAAAPAPTPRRPKASLEDLVGGRLLAWAGGLAALGGVVLLFAIAVSNGWIGEATRALFAAAGALALGAGGVWLHEHRGRTEAALVATSTAIAALFVTVAVSAQVYELVPSVAGSVLAMLVGGTAAGLAIRWRSQGLAALGIVGGLLAPLLAGTEATFGTMALLWIAAAAATVVVVDRRWAWLALVTFVLTTAQWAGYLMSGAPTGTGLVVLIAFGGLTAMAALGHELRSGGDGLAPWSSVLFTLNALVLAVAGWLFLYEEATRAAADAWLIGLALVHLAAAVGALRSSRLSHVVGVSIATVGVLLADLALALSLEGAPRALAYAGGAVAIAGLVRWLRPTGRDAGFLGAGLGGHLCLAIVQLGLTDARPDLLDGGQVVSPATVVAGLAVAMACFGAARLTLTVQSTWRTALDMVGLALIAYLTALSFDGVALVAAWSAEAISLALLARRHSDRVAEAGAAGFAVLALGHALIIEASPMALVEGLPDMSAAVAALGCATAAALAWPVLRLGDRRERAIGCAAGGVLLLYLVSTALISAFQPDVVTAAASELELGVRQQGQVLLSALWAITGTIGVIVGLRRDLRPLRLAALGLLLAALGKLVTYDLAELTAIYRVASCVVIGVLLLLTGFVWQRLRPQAAPDLREVPPALR